MLSTLCCAIIGIHMATAHVDADRPMNDTNPGIYVQATNNIVVGTYYNSIKRQTTYVGYTYSTKYVDFTTGVATGYNKSVIPMFVPSTKFGPIRVAYLPKMHITSAHIIHFSIEKEFK